MQFIISTNQNPPFKFFRSTTDKALELAQAAGDDEFRASGGRLQNYLRTRREQFSPQTEDNFETTAAAGSATKTVKIYHADEEDVSPEAVLSESDWQHGRDVYVVRYSWEDDCYACGFEVRFIPENRSRKRPITVVLAAIANGRKLQPFIVFKGMRYGAEFMQKISCVVVGFNNNGWINERLTIAWVQRAYGTFNFASRLLLWDAYKCHHTATVKSTVDKQTNTGLVVILEDWLA